MILILPLLLACADPVDEVQLTGQVLAEQDGSTGAPGVSVVLRDGQTDVYSETTTDDDGVFKIASPPSSAYHLAFSAPDFATTAFSGIIGSKDQSIARDLLWVRSEADVSGIRALFEACEDAEAEGGIIEGVVWYRVQDQLTGDYKVADEVAVKVFDNRGIAYPVCYLDEDGVSDEDGVQVGATGRFAAFGLPEAPMTVEFNRDFGANPITSYAFVYLPENGIAPFHPALIEFP